MVFAHQGGWDEALFVAIPIGLFAFLLYLANKRAKAQLEAEPDGHEQRQDVASEEAD
jgi:hypothetical protein